MYIHEYKHNDSDKKEQAPPIEETATATYKEETAPPIEDDGARIISFISSSFIILILRMSS